MADKLFDVLGALVMVAMVTTIVAHKNTSKVIDAAGKAFTSAIEAATGHVRGA